jgi:hypothetical protein
MSKRKDPVDQVVAFFETAPLDQAVMVLAIVRGILARRQPKTKPAKPARKGGLLLDGAERPPAAPVGRDRCGTLRQPAATRLHDERPGRPAALLVLQPAQSTQPRRTRRPWPGPVRNAER